MSFRAQKMSSVVSYSLLLMIICFSCSLQDPLEKVTVVKGHHGGNVNIQCATEDKNQDGVFMYRKKPEETNKQSIFYFYKDGTLTLNEAANVRVNLSGTFPNLTINLFNLTVTDSAMYWCEFNWDDKITHGMVTGLWVMDLAAYRNAEECPENHFLLSVMIGCTLFSVITLL